MNMSFHGVLGMKKAPTMGCPIVIGEKESGLWDG